MIMPPVEDREGEASRRPLARPPGNPLNIGALKWFVALASLAILFGPGLVQHARLSATPHEFNDDARQQIVPFLLEDSSHGGDPDYISTYFLDTMPRGYSALYRSARTVVDPRTVSKVLPYLLIGLTLVLLGMGAGDLGGAAARWGTIALCLSGGLIFHRITGGLPRAFAFPAVALIALGLVRNRPTWIALATIAGALFYYSIAVLGGLVLVLYTFRIPPGYVPHLPDERRRRRWILLLGTGTLTALLVLPAVISVRAYGPATTAADFEQYPELGPGGRRSGGDMPGAYNLDQHLVKTARRAFFGDPEYAFLRNVNAQAINHHRTTSWILIGLTLLVSVPLARTNAAMRRLLLLPLAALIGYLCARQFAPLLHLPERYIVYGLPLFAYLALPAGVVATAKTLRVSRPDIRTPPIISIAVIALIVLVVGGRGPGSNGFFSAGVTEPSVIEKIGELPDDVLIAGWPWGVIENVSYLTSRPTLVSFENHVMVHRDYVEEMGKRTRAVIGAYFSSGPEPLLELRDRFGVTHLLIDRRHYSGEPPWYFQPFLGEAIAAREQLRGEPEPLRQTQHAAMIEDGPYFLLDLERIEAEFDTGQ